MNTPPSLIGLSGDAPRVASNLYTFGFPSANREEETIFPQRYDIPAFRPLFLVLQNSDRYFLTDTMLARIRTICIALFALTGTGCSNFDCSNNVIEESISPNGNMKVIVFSRDCGATTGLNTQATVLAKDEKLPDDAGNAFIIDNGTAKISWKNNNSILVTHDRNARIFKRETFIRGISVEYNKND